MESIIRDHIMDYFSITTTSVIISMVLLRVDLPYYNYFVLWMIGLLNLIQEHR